MCQINIAAGLTFWFFNTAPRKRHLHFLILAPTLGCDGVVVNITDENQNYIHSACTLIQGEHPKVTKDSVVDYYRAFPISEDAIRSSIHNGSYEVVSPATPQLIQKMVAGANQFKKHLAPRVRSIPFP